MPKLKGRSLDALVSNYGLSSDAIRIIRKEFPKGSLETILRSFSRFTLTAESREEQKWPPFSHAVLKDHLGVDVVLERYHSIAFVLPGAVYTPDYAYIMSDGSRVMVEVKGSEFQPGYRDAIAKMRSAATLNFDYRFVLAMPSKEAPNGWRVQTIEPDEKYGAFLEELADVMDTKE